MKNNNGLRELSLDEIILVSGGLSADLELSPKVDGVLAALVEGTISNVYNPPRAGWPEGDGFRVTVDL